MLGLGFWLLIARGVDVGFGGVDGLEKRFGDVASVKGQDKRNFVNKAGVCERRKPEERKRECPAFAMCKLGWLVWELYDVNSSAATKKARQHANDGRNGARISDKTR